MNDDDDDDDDDNTDDDEGGRTRREDVLLCWDEEVEDIFVYFAGGLQRLEYYQTEPLNE